MITSTIRPSTLTVARPMNGSRPAPPARAFQAASTSAAGRIAPRVLVHCAVTTALFAGVPNDSGGCENGHDAPGSGVAGLVRGRSPDPDEDCDLTRREGAPARAVDRRERLEVMGERGQAIDPLVGRPVLLLQSVRRERRDPCEPVIRLRRREERVARHPVPRGVRARQRDGLDPEVTPEEVLRGREESTQVLLLLRVEPTPGHRAGRRAVDQETVLAELERVGLRHHVARVVEADQEWRDRHGGRSRRRGRQAGDPVAAGPPTRSRWGPAAGRGWPARTGSGSVSRSWASRVRRAPRRSRRRPGASRRGTRRRACQRRRRRARHSTPASPAPTRTLRATRPRGRPRRSSGMSRATSWSRSSGC